MRRTASVTLLSAALLASVTVAHADLVTEANRIRASGCSGRPAVPTPLRARRALDDAARLFSAGVPIEDALSEVGYAADESIAVRVSSRGNDRYLADSLRTHFCRRLTDPALRDIGVYRSGDERWFVLAAPFSAPALNDATRVSQRVLELVNQARTRSRRCGRESFKAAPGLKLVAALERAARVHAADMAQHSYLEHTGRDGSSPGSRLNRTGYKRTLVGENIAAGPRTAEEVVRGWLDSPGHCANIMDRRFRHMGVAYTVNPSSTHGVYWAQVFAAPR